MNAQVDENLVTIEIDGRELKAPKGSVIIQAADKVGIPIPRFCYHPKLAIAANCRQCLVEVEMGGRMVPKPQPACATPVAEGMKVWTRSENALKWQRNTMEFLLINHPLDCPICDQGGECELQDLAMGYGRSVSRFTERKRTLADEDVGPLVETFMTRCIYCTRCVRVLDEVAGTNEFGGMNRGENLEIGTWIGKSIESELSGNIIDVCPVGALTDKVFKFQARAWELTAHESIGYHDALGSNLWLHTRHGKILRAVPRDNEAVNECWLADRDRYSHQGLYHDDRVKTPLVRTADGWRAASWDEAIAAVKAGLEGLAGADIGMLAHPGSSCEEGLLLGRIAAALGCANLDHRLRQLDPALGAAQTFEMPVEQIMHAKATLLVGSYLRHELPLVNHRLRDSVTITQPRPNTSQINHGLRDHSLGGAKVYTVSSLAEDVNFLLAGRFLAAPQALVDELLVLAGAAQELGSDVAPPAGRFADALAAVEVTPAAREAVKALAEAPNSLVIFGQQAAMHPEARWLHAAARYIAAATGSAFNAVPLGANAIGLGRVGVLPGADGLDALAMLRQQRKAYLLFGAEPPHDFVDGKLAREALAAADFVAAFAAYRNEALEAVANVILPIAPLPMSAATLVNVDGIRQHADPATAPVSETRDEYRAHISSEAQPTLPPAASVRAGWDALRALGVALGAEGFDFTAPAELGADLDAVLGQPAAAVTPELGARPLRPATGLTRMDSLPIYRTDAVLRRAKALNDHPLTRPPEVVLAPADAAALDLADGQQVRVTGGQVLPLRVDERVAAGAVWIQSSYPETAELVPLGATITVESA